MKDSDRPWASVWYVYMRLKGGRPTFRNKRHMPLWVHLRHCYHESAVGKWSARVSWQTHCLAGNVGAWLVHKARINRVRRRWEIFFCTGFSLFAGYMLAGFGTNLYTMGYKFTIH